MEIELPVAVGWIITVLLAALTLLAGIVAWFLRREIKNNDEAHRELRGDIKKLLEGDVVWVRTLLNR
ncbi:MAG: hypothetical protein OXQ28_15690 [Acidobacteriota bacterium]|nr:hypothetical protein [Acidobacteriota bacterium]